jgi:hypothetical protein
LVRLRDILRGGAGRWSGLAFAAAAIVALAFVLHRTFGDSEAVASAKDRVFICAETGKSFRHEIRAGEAVPVRSPHSGRDTGYLAELCYWTPDGRAKDEPTAVLLNTYVGRGGATFCPECKRLVVGHNPRPEPGAKPPPLEGEYVAREGGRRDER